MWPASFDLRLESWYAMREQARQKPLLECLTQINQWWMGSPWLAYHLHWQDRQTWPDPWQLLADNVYCDLARALGILYTVVLLDRADISDAKIVEIDQGNLVLVTQEKYILNWERDIIVNTNLESTKFLNQLCQVELKQLLY
jgi:hypothetical protein